MQEKMNRIRELLKNQLFLPEDQKKMILSDLENFPEEKLDYFLTMLEEADQEQTEVFSAAVKENPNLISEINFSINHSKMKGIRDQEVHDFEDHEANFLQNMEKELSNIDS